MLTSSAASEALDPSIDPLIASLRTREFGRLDREGLAYLDYTGSALYAESQLRAHHAFLSRAVLGNPHAESDPSRASGDLISRARAEVLDFFDADVRDYTVCFTSNTSAAVKLVAESYPFNVGSRLVLSADNHNSINGVREYARRGGAAVTYLPLDDALTLVDAPARLAALASAPVTAAKLFAFPAQSNFSGVKHPLSLIRVAQSHGFDVLLDAAAFAPSNPLSLRRHPADFVPISFYKMFGYPTGIGAMIIRRTALAKLRRPWFAGGTVDFASVQNDLYQLRDDAEGFEDGTPDFLSIAALAGGFALLRGIGMERIQAHVTRLSTLLLDGLRELTHTNGAPLVQVYGPNDSDARGGTVAFNVITSQGRCVPYVAVERRARDAGVAVRGGCFCNPGAAERAFGFDAARARSCLIATERGAFTIERFAECLAGDTPVGAVRASVGLANNARDVDRVLALVRSFAS